MNQLSFDMFNYPPAVQQVDQNAVRLATARTGVLKALEWIDGEFNLRMMTAIVNHGAEGPFCVHVNWAVPDHVSALDVGYALFRLTKDGIVTELRHYIGTSAPQPPIKGKGVDDGYRGYWSKWRRA